jgi:hypothetical protein
MKVNTTGNRPPSSGAEESQLEDEREAAEVAGREGKLIKLF